MTQPTKPLILITGGDSGIGFELARQFAGNGANLLLVSENETGLADARERLTHTFKDATIYVFVQDLTATDGPYRVRSFTETQGLTIDVLVNNAGIGSYGYYQELEPAREAQMIRLNILALEAMTRLFLPQLLASSQGGLINLASIAAFQPVPTMAVYGATKAFVLHFSKALRFELRQQNHVLPVLAVCPSGTRHTAFRKRAGMEGNPLFENFMSVDPAQVARRAYRAYRRNRAEVIIPGWLDIVAPLVRRLPRRLLTWQAWRTLKE